MDDLQVVLSATLEGFDHVHFILDALDECPKADGEREKLLNLIRDMNGLTIDSICSPPAARKRISRMQ
jgi:hypothetical protein